MFTVLELCRFLCFNLCSNLSPLQYIVLKSLWLLCFRVVIWQCNGYYSKVISWYTFWCEIEYNSWHGGVLDICQKLYFSWLFCDFINCVALTFLCLTFLFQSSKAAQYPFGMWLWLRRWVILCLTSSLPSVSKIILIFFRMLYCRSRRKEWADFM